jgi:hypothetical protein
MYNTKAYNTPRTFNIYGSLADLLSSDFTFDFSRVGLYPAISPSTNTLSTAADYLAGSQGLVL